MLCAQPIGAINLTTLKLRATQHPQPATLGQVFVFRHPSSIITKAETYTLRTPSAQLQWLPAAICVHTEGCQLIALQYWQKGGGPLQQDDSTACTALTGVLSQYTNTSG